MPDNLKHIAHLAHKGNESAQEQLIEAAIDAGMSQDEIDACSTWLDVYRKLLPTKSKSAPSSKRACNHKPSSCRPRRPSPPQSEEGRRHHIASAAIEAVEYLRSQIDNLDLCEGAAMAFFDSLSTIEHILADRIGRDSLGISSNE